MSTPVYVCSSNSGKLREFEFASATYSGDDFLVRPLPGLREITQPAENGTTFEENAALKASYYSQFTSDWIFSDDSGLEVQSLGGAPGVYSARFAGPEASDTANNELLLRRLAGVENRGARFCCVISLARDGKVVANFRGAVDGTVLTAAQGGEGFGYDPIFYYPPAKCSFAELIAAEKFKVSHRGQAFGKLLEWLTAQASTPLLHQ